MTDLGYVYMESDDCDETIDILSELPTTADGWGEGPFHVECFDAVRP